MFDQLRRAVSTHLMSNLDILKTEQDNLNVQLVQLTQEHNQYSSDWSNEAARLQAQEDLDGMQRTLAQQVENPQLIPAQHSLKAPLLSSWI